MSYSIYQVNLFSTLLKSEKQNRVEFFSFKTLFQSKKQSVIRDALKRKNENSKQQKNNAEKKITYKVRHNITYNNNNLHCLIIRKNISQ